MLKRYAGNPDFIHSSKYILSLGLLVFLLATPVEGLASLGTDDIQSPHGVTIQVPLKTEGVKNLGAIDVVVSYNDSVLEFQRAEKRSVSSQAMVEYQEIIPGRIQISIIDPQGISGKETIIDLSFRVTGSSGSFSEISLIPIHGYDLALDEVYLEGGKGKVRVTSESKSMPLSGISAIVALTIIFLFIVRKTDP